MKIAFLMWIGLAALLAAETAGEEAHSDQMFVDRIVFNSEGVVAYVWKEGASEFMMVRAEPNALGWKMEAIEGDLATGEGVVAKIENADGEIVEAPLKKAKLERKRIPEEAVNRVRELSLEQRQELIEKMKMMRDKNPEITREQLRERFFEFVDQIDGVEEPES